MKIHPQLVPKALTLESKSKPNTIVYRLVYSAKKTANLVPYNKIDQNNV